MFYLTIHSTHFIYGYMASDIWLRTILIVRKETRCCHMGYSFRLTARVLLYAPSHRQDSTYHGLCYTSRGALAGTRSKQTESLCCKYTADLSYPHGAVALVVRLVAGCDENRWILQARKRFTDCYLKNIMKRPSNADHVIRFCCLFHFYELKTKKSSIFCNTL